MDDARAVSVGSVDVRTLDEMQAKYGTRERGVFLYAMGDGNHSLATAKGIWEEIKAGRNAADMGDHPARHALVELVNVLDRGLRFEPIHRVLFGVDSHAFLAEMDAYFKSADPTYRRTRSGPDAVQRCLQAGRGETLIAHVDASGFSLATQLRRVDMHCRACFVHRRVWFALGPGPSN